MKSTILKILMTAGTISVIGLVGRAMWVFS